MAVDFYDGCLIYDFARRMIWLCDLDCYRPGPYVLDRDREYGSGPLHGTRGVRREREGR